MEIAHEDLPRHKRLSAWVIALFAAVPGSALAWRMSADPGRFGHLMGASVALFIAGAILLTQPRTRSAGIGLIIGFAMCYYMAVTPGLIGAVFRML